MKRGDMVVVAAPGDYGIPRPAVVVQADALTESGIGSVILCFQKLLELVEAGNPWLVTLLFPPFP